MAAFTGLRQLASLAAASVLGLAAPNAVLAQAPAPSSQTPPAQAGGAIPRPAGEGSPVLTAQDAQAWLDGFMPFALRRAAIPGAVVVIVKDGRVLLEKGYGVSDVARATPVDAGATLFRVGSVSKLFTWTAVMQLVEQGRLNLDADVNTYLDFKIPPRHGAPITLRNLMTHTSGFEEQVRGIATEDPKGVRSLGAALKASIPQRIYAPGTTPAYSNYGAALAGYIVERVSGEPFEAYVAHHIFAPLGMGRSTFAQPLAPALMANMSRGYLSAAQPPYPYENIVWRPAGALTTTGDDMARFLIAHLQDGRFGDARILRPETARYMHSHTLTLLPPLDCMALGFYEMNLNGRRIIGHDGDTVLFHANVSLFPDEGVGLFFAFNGLGADAAAYTVRSGLFTGFADRYFPQAGAPAVPPRVSAATAAAHAALLAGEYAPSRSFNGSFLYALKLVMPIKALANADGTVSVTGTVDAGGALRRYREVSPFVWRQVDGHDRLAAEVSDGRVVRFSDDEASPFMVMLPTPAWRSSAILPPALAALLVVLLTALAWPIRAALRLRSPTRDRSGDARERGRGLVAVSAWLIVAAAAGWGRVLALLRDPRGIFQLEQHDLFVHGVQLLTMAGLAVGLLAAGYRLVAVLRAPCGLFVRGWSVAVLASVVMLAWVALAGRLLGFSTHF
jgi:CubicO group peptidase (beta-lactamase class C family)